MMYGYLNLLLAAMLLLAGAPPGRRRRAATGTDRSAFVFDDAGVALARPAAGHGAARADARAGGAGVWLVLVSRAGG